MKVKLFLFIFLYSCNTHVHGAYTIPVVKLELIPNGFRISIPDEPGILGVLYIMEVNNNCSEMFNYVDKPINNMWPSEQYNTKLEINDELGVGIWVQQKDDVFKATQFFKVSSQTPVSNTLQYQPATVPSPTPSHTPSQLPSQIPSQVPSQTPSQVPTQTPSQVPTQTPSQIPNQVPSQVPIQIPSQTPSQGPTPQNPTNLPGPTTVSAAKCVPAETTVGDRAVKCQGDLVYEQTFDGISELPRTHWNYDIRVRLNPTDSEEFSVFSDNKTNCFVNNGVLNFVPTLAETDIRRGNIQLKGCTALRDRDCRRKAAMPTQFLPPIYAAQVHTKNFFSFKFGTIEIRAKLPIGDWLLPYIMLQPMTSHPDTHRATQIRVAFALGNARLPNSRQEEIGGSRLHAGPVLWKDDDTRENLMKSFRGQRHFGDDFHIYTLAWTKKSISVAVDGVVYGHITDGMSRFSEEFFIIMGISAGGHHEFVDVGNGMPWINTNPKAVLEFWKRRNQWIPSWSGGHAMQIDYVRVYAV